MLLSICGITTYEGLTYKGVPIRGWVGLEYVYSTPPLYLLYIYILYKKGKQHGDFTI